MFTFLQNCLLSKFSFFFSFTRVNILFRSAFRISELWTSSNSQRPVYKQQLTRWLDAKIGLKCKNSSLMCHFQDDRTIRINLLVCSGWSSRAKLWPLVAKPHIVFFFTTKSRYLQGNWHKVSAVISQQNESMSHFCQFTKQTLNNEQTSRGN